MKTVLFLLFAVFGYSVEGLKIRAVRSRVIQYLPFNQQTHTKSQYFHWLPQNQLSPINKNGRLIYSYVNPGGERFNTFGGLGAYAGYLTNYPNSGQGYQYVHRNWPSSMIQGISVNQNGLNSGYNGLIGQSMHQNWQNPANGNPIDISIEQSGINPGNRGHVQTIYQRWQNSADGRPFYAPLEKGVNSGHRDDIALYQNWLNSATLRPNDTFVMPGGLNPGNIDQSLYESWQDSAGGRPSDASVKQKGVLYPSHVGTPYQKLQNYDAESVVDLSTSQTHNSKDKNRENSGDFGVINFPVVQTDSIPAYGVPVDSVQQDITNFGQNNYDMDQGQNSQIGGQDIVSLDQNGLNGDQKPQVNDILQEINVNTEDNTDPKHSIIGHDLTLAVDESKLNRPNEAPPQNIEKYISINNDENISPIGTTTENYPISPDKGDITSVDQSKQNWANQDPWKEYPFNNEEGVSPISAVTEIDLGSPNNELMTSLDHSKLNGPDQMQDIEKDFYINNEGNYIPAKIITENDQTSPDHNTDTLTNVETNEKEDSAPVSTVPQNDLIPTDDENVSSVGQSKFNEATRAPLRQILNEIITNKAENSAPGSLNEKNPIYVNKKLYPTYQTNQEQPLLPNHPDILISNAQQSPAPIYPYMFDPNQQQSEVPAYPDINKFYYPNQRQNPGDKMSWNEATITRQRQPVNKMQPGSQQWIKNIASNISPQEVNSVYLSMCQNPATNVIPEREKVYSGDQNSVSIRDLMEHIKTFGIHDTPQFIEGPTKIDHTNPNLNKGIYPYLDLPNEFNIQFENWKPNEHPLPLVGIEANENKEAIRKNPDSHVIYIKPDDVQQYVGTENLVPIFPQPVTSSVTKTPENTGYDNQLLTPKQYVYQVTKTLMPELLRLYHSKCDSGYGEKLLKEFKTLIDSIQGEYCELS